MKEAEQVKVIAAVTNLSMALNKYHAGTLTAQYVQETLTELKSLNSKAFTGTFEYFIIKSSMLRTSENITLNEIERARWFEVSSLKDLGNDLFFGMGLGF